MKFDIHPDHPPGIGIPHIVDPVQHHREKALLPGRGCAIGTVGAGHPPFQWTCGLHRTVLHEDLHQLGQIAPELGIEIGAHRITGGQDEGGIGKRAKRPGKAPDLLPGLAMFSDDQAMALAAKIRIIIGQVKSRLRRQLVAVILQTGQKVRKICQRGLMGIVDRPAVKFLVEGFGQNALQGIATARIQPQSWMRIDRERQAGFAVAQMPGNDSRGIAIGQQKPCGCPRWEPSDRSPPRSATDLCPCAGRYRACENPWCRTPSPCRPPCAHSAKSHSKYRRRYENRVRSAAPRQPLPVRSSPGRCAQPACRRSTADDARWRNYTGAP